MLFGAIFKVKSSSFYYASLHNHQVDGAVLTDNEMHSKLVITYTALCGLGWLALCML